jgi:hypothetical protein
MLGTALGLLFVFLIVAFALPNTTLYTIEYQLAAGKEFGRSELWLFNQLTKLRTTDPGVPIVVYIGGSTTREGITSETGLERAIMAAGGPQTRVYDLTSPGQPMIISWVLAEEAACHGADVVVVGLNQNRLRKGPRNRHPIEDTVYWGEDVRQYVEAGLYKDRHAGPTSTILAEARARLGIASQIIAATFKVGKKVGKKAAETDRRTDGDHHFINGRIRPNRAVTTLNKIESVAAVSPLSYEYLTRIRSSVGRCGARFSTFLTTVNPIGVDPASFPIYSAAVTGLKSGVLNAGIPASEIIDVREKLAVTETDFYDWGHLRSADAISRSTDIIAAGLVPLLTSVTR